MTNKGNDQYENVTLGDLADGFVVNVIFVIKEIVAPIIAGLFYGSLVIAMLGAIILAIISVVFRWDKYPPFDSTAVNVYSAAFITGLVAIILFVIASAIWSKMSGIVVYRKKIQEDEAQK